MNYAKNIVISREKINKSLNSARKGIHYMTKVKSRNNIKQELLSKKDKRIQSELKAKLEENQAVVRNPDLLESVQTMTNKKKNIVDYQASKGITSINYDLLDIDDTDNKLLSSTMIINSQDYRQIRPEN